MMRPIPSARRPRAGRARPRPRHRPVPLVCRGVCGEGWCQVRGRGRGRKGARERAVASEGEGEGEEGGGRACGHPSGRPRQIGYSPTGKAPPQRHPRRMSSLSHKLGKASGGEGGTLCQVKSAVANAPTGNCAEAPGLCVANFMDTPRNVVVCRAFQARWSLAAGATCGGPWILCGKISRPI